MATATTQENYENEAQFVDVFRAAHPYLSASERLALAELAAIWASRNIANVDAVNVIPR